QSWPTPTTPPHLRARHRRGMDRLRARTAARRAPGAPAAAPRIGLRALREDRPALEGGGGCRPQRGLVSPPRRGPPPAPRRLRAAQAPALCFPCPPPGL